MPDWNEINLRQYVPLRTLRGAVNKCIKKALQDLGAYLIFVIFFTQSNFLENKIDTEKRQIFALNL